MESGMLQGTLQEKIEITGKTHSIFYRYIFWFMYAINLAWYIRILTTGEFMYDLIDLMKTFSQEVLMLDVVFWPSDRSDVFSCEEAALQVLMSVCL